jgi:LPPG:FO 2-phospho-L-lactate transferase
MKIVALAGGVGGAKLAQGLSAVLPEDELIVVVNTGDDFTFYGLYICPDLDTVTYTLAGMANPVTGWGILDDSFKVYEKLKANGSPDWFMLGDQDLATHLERTRLLQAGRSLTQVTLHFRDVWNIKHRILPMCDQPVPTIVHTRDKGLLSFQEYFVKYHFEPVVEKIIFRDINQARPDKRVLQALDQADAVIICPSNPLVSIAPILSVPGIRERMASKYVLAVSPIVGGKAIKGPLAKIYGEMGIEPNPVNVARYYAEFLDCIFLDNQDVSYGKEIEQSGIIFQATDIMMPDLPNRIRLAEDILEFLRKEII